MKKILLTIPVFFACAVGYAQLHKPTSSSTDFAAALEKIVLDFRMNYRTIQNDSSFATGGDYETYGSSVTLPGSSNCQILRFHSKKDNTAAFEANFYQGEDYDEALKAYQNCIHMIKKSAIHWIDKHTVTFSGDEAKPDQSLPFTVSTLHLAVNDIYYQNFCAEIEIRGDVTGWTVSASFHDKRPDTEGASN